MSLYGLMRTGVSGMNAQASRLGTVADNIANANTVGYKKAGTEFSTLVMPSSVTTKYSSGAVTTSVRYSISEPGPLQFTTSETDMALQGNGFFIVESPNGEPFLTRAGSFVPNGDGVLVNAAGYALMGYDYTAGTPAPVVNGFDGLVPIDISSNALSASPSQNGLFAANLPSTAAEVTGNTPSANAVDSEFSEKSSLVVYDNLGGEVLLDIYYTKTAADTWEVAVYDRADAGPDGFPYAAGPLTTANLVFDPTTGALDASSDTEFNLTVPNGAALTVDLSQMSQLAYDFAVDDAAVDGNAPSQVTGVQISDDGIVYAQYESGKIEPLYRVGLADVPSPDQLRPLPGNVYAQGVDSGVIRTGFAGQGSFGTVVSGALESSNVDIAEELTNMIESQRSYTANSKVFQTGSDLMDVLVNLKR